MTGAPWRLTVSYRDDGDARVVGELARGRVVAFQYGSEWLAGGVELSPEHLPLSVGREIQYPPGGSRLHGLFVDALPDSWGERIMRMAFQRIGVAWSDVSELDRLAALGTRAIGALSFAPPRELQQASPPGGVGSLDSLSETVDALLNEGVSSADDSALDRLQRVAATPGGAQPKVLVGIRESDGTVFPDPEPPPGFTPYLVKFSPMLEAMNLSPAIGAIESAYADMARAAGLTVPPTRVLRTADGRVHFGIARFDRTPSGGRRHVHSIAGLLGRAPADAFDYDELCRVVVNLTGDQRMVTEAFARCAFNVLAANDDDHGRNTSFLLDPKRGWTLSPAYDLVFQPGRGTRGMTVRGKERDILRTDLMALARDHLIPESTAVAITERVRGAVLGWPGFAQSSGVPGDWLDEIERAIRSRVATMFQ